MKRTLTYIAVFAALTGCGTAPTATTTDTVQVGYAQACAAYSVAFAGALQLRKAGKLDAMQVSQVSLIDGQVTPICTGALPVDPGAATMQIAAAVTALTILEYMQ